MPTPPTTPFTEAQLERLFTEKMTALLSMVGTSSFSSLISHQSKLALQFPAVVAHGMYQELSPQERQAFAASPMHLEAGMKMLVVDALRNQLLYYQENPEKIPTISANHINQIARLTGSSSPTALGQVHALQSWLGTMTRASDLFLFTEGGVRQPSYKAAYLFDRLLEQWQKVEGVNASTNPLNITEEDMRKIGVRSYRRPRGYTALPEQIEAIFWQGDKNRDGEIQPPEFLEIEKNLPDGVRLSLQGVLLPEVRVTMQDGRSFVVPLNFSPELLPARRR